jgi:hypothetical protein
MSLSFFIAPPHWSEKLQDLTTLVFTERRLLGRETALI